MTQTYQERLISIIGQDAYSRLDKEADKDVALALKMPLINSDNRENYYRPRYLLEDLLPDCKLFESAGLKVSPLDIVNVLFRCKLLFATKNEEEYNQRVGGGSYGDEWQFIINWKERADGHDEVIRRYLDRIETFLTERIVLTRLSHFQPESDKLSNFLSNLFVKLDIPLEGYLDNDDLVAKHKLLEPQESSYTPEEAKKYFHSPSLGCKIYGSHTYTYLYACSWLRTFLNILRIASFIHPGQVDFGQSNIEVTPPKAPVFLGDRASGGYCWDEDVKKPWEKMPDGCLFLSFGYRGLSRMWLDERVFSKLDAFINDNQIVFKHLKNPWAPAVIDDVAPSLDILSTATQIPDLGAKILLIYCCLEHLFVPKELKTDNKQYLVGGINALRPDMLPWFNKLYKLRCDYAHKGYVLKTNEVRMLIFESMKNACTLLSAKLSMRMAA